MDVNLTYHEGFPTRGPVDSTSEEMWRWSVGRSERATFLELEYERGDIVAINGQQMSPAKVQTLNQVAGANGIGRLDIVENRYVGMKSAEHMKLGGTVMLKAHRAIESLTSIANCALER